MKEYRKGVQGERVQEGGAGWYSVMEYTNECEADTMSEPFYDTLYTLPSDTFLTL